MENTLIPVKARIAIEGLTLYIAKIDRTRLEKEEEIIRELMSRKLFPSKTREAARKRYRKPIDSPNFILALKHEFTFGPEDPLLHNEWRRKEVEDLIRSINLVDPDTEVLFSEDHAELIAIGFQNK